MPQIPKLTLIYRFNRLRYKRVAQTLATLFALLDVTYWFSSDAVFVRLDTIFPARENILLVFAA